MEHSSNLRQDGAKQRKNFTKTNNSKKRGRTSLVEEEEDQNLHARKKVRDNGELISTGEKKMENDLTEVEGIRIEVEECHTLVDKQKPSSNSGGTIGNFANTWEDGKK